MKFDTVKAKKRKWRKACRGFQRTTCSSALSWEMFAWRENKCMDLGRKTFVGDEVAIMIVFLYNITIADKLNTAKSLFSNFLASLLSVQGWLNKSSTSH